MSFSQSWVTGRSGLASDRLREKSNFGYVSVRRYNERVFLKRAPFHAGVCIYET